MAIEDIGLAAPEALNLTLSAKEAIDFLGSPEGDLALAEAVVYLCLAPKSNSFTPPTAPWQSEIEATRQEPVPLHLRNAPTKLMKELDYGKATATPTTKRARWPTWIACLTRSKAQLLPSHAGGREKLLAQRMEEIRRIRSAKRGGD